MDEVLKLELEREEKQRRGRLKELEEMVQKLQSENKKLLSQVGRTSKPATTKIEITASEPISDEPGKLEEVQDIINLNDFEEERNEDEWLYVSPVRPPTPQDKSITPDEWLKTGENENVKRSSIPSLDEVKKQLLCYAMDLELNTGPSKQQGLLSPDSSPKINLRRVQSLSNKTAQKYLDQVRTKRRSLDRTDVSSSPTKEVVEEQQEDRPQHNQQPIESLMKTYALNTSDLHASPNAANSSPLLKPRNMPIRAIIPPGKNPAINSDVQHQERESSPDDTLQKRATPPLEYAQKGPSQSPSPDYAEQQEQYNRTGAIQVSNLRKSPVFPRRIIQPAAHVIPSPQQQQQQQQQQQHRQQLPHPSKTVSPKGSPMLSRRTIQEPSGSIRPPQGGGSMVSRLSPGRTMGGTGGIKAPATGMTKSSHAFGSLQQQQPVQQQKQQQQQQQQPVQQQQQKRQQQQQHLQGNIARPMGKPLTKQSSPLQQRGQLMGPSQSLRGGMNHHQQQRPPTHRNAIPPRETVPRYQHKGTSEEDSSWMEGCY